MRDAFELGVAVVVVAALVAIGAAGGYQAGRDSAEAEVSRARDRCPEEFIEQKPRHPERPHP